MANPPGTLDWRPAVAALDLLAPVVAATVAELGLDAYAAPIDATLADTAAFCDAYAVTPAQSANCVIIEGARGETQATAAVMVLASHRADVNKTIRKHLGLRKVSFAAREDATTRSQMEFGGITPIGLPPEWPVLVDAAVAAGDWLVIGSGVRGSKLAVRGRDLARLPTAEVLALATPVES